MKRLLPIGAWLALLALVAVAVAFRPEERAARADAQRRLAFPVDQPLSFPLDPGEEQIKLVGWLTMPPRWARDVRAWSAYRLQLTVRDAAGEIRWEGATWRRTRTSWVLGGDGGLLRGAWLPRSRADVNDARVSLIDVTGLVPDGGELEVQATSPVPGASLMVLAYRHSWRTAAARLRIEAGSRPQNIERAGERITDAGFATLPPPWQSRMAERLWERLSPVPDRAGRPVTPVEVLTSRPEHDWEAQPALGMPLPPGAAVAFNLLEGGELNARWRDLSGRRLSAAPTWMQLVHADGTTEVTFLGVVDQIGPIHSDEPLLSVHLALDPGTEGGRVIQAEVNGSQGRALLWGDPPLAPLEQSDRWLAAPDMRSLEMFRARPDADPVHFPVLEDREMLRLSLRPRLPAGPLPAFGLRWDPATNTTEELPAPVVKPVRVLVTARDRQGEELARWETAVSALPTAFERFSQGDDPGTGRCTEPESRILVPPAGTAEITVGADSDLDVAVRAWSPDNPPAGVSRGYELPAALAPPLDENPTARLPIWTAGQLRESHGFRVARYEPYAQDAWRARAPSGRSALMDQGRVSRIEAQVRLEQEGAWLVESAWMSEDPVAIRGTGTQVLPTEQNALDLPGPYELLVEPDRDGQARAGARTRLTEQATGVDIAASGRLDIDYRVPPARAGSDVTVTINGESSVHRLAAAAGRLRVAGQRPGRGTAAISPVGGDLFLARSSGDRLHQVRRVHSLQPGETATLRIPGGPQRLTLFTYGDGGWLEWRLLGGEAAEAPAMMERSTRRFGRHRLRQEGGTAAPLSFAAPSIARLTPLVVRIGADLGAAPLTLELKLTGTDQPTWMRATATWAPRPVLAGGRTRVRDR